MKKIFIPSLHLLLFLITFIINACAKLASDFDANSSVEEIIKHANEAFEKRDYTRAAEIYLKVEEFYPYSDSSREALVNAINSYHAGSKFNELKKTSKKYLDLYPKDKNASFAKYMVGMSYFEQIIDVERDQGATRDSIKEFEELIDFYPKSKYVLKAKRNNPLSAIKRFKTVIDDHKNTPYYPEALFRSIEAYAMLGINHKVKGYVKILKKEFPDSEWNNLALNLMKEYGIKVD